MKIRLIITPGIDRLDSAIDAIKTVRSISAMGLKEAKDIVDAARTGGKPQIDIPERDFRLAKDMLRRVGISIMPDIESATLAVESILSVATERKMWPQVATLAHALQAANEVSEAMDTDAVAARLLGTSSEGEMREVPF